LKKVTNEIDRLNTKINQLTIKSITFKLPDKGKYDYVLCKCDCGNVKILRYGNILNKNTKTCGCGPRGPKIGSKSKRRKLFDNIWNPVRIRVYDQVWDSIYYQIYDH
jgi:hypothetical protein